MLGLVPVLLFAATPVRDPLAPFRGQPVVSVDVDTPAGEHKEELERLIDIAPGYLLSTAAVQTALKRLYALGRFADVAVYAERLSGAVVLHFQLRPVQRLAGLDVQGLERADAGGLTAAVRLPVGAEVDRRTSELITERAKAYLTRAGFPRAEVKVEERTGSENAELSYVVRVREGEPRRVRRIEVAGGPRVSEYVLRDRLVTRRGSIVDMSELERDRGRLEAALLNHGFWHAKVAQAVVTGDDTAADVRFLVDAGDRMALFLTGNVVLTDPELRALWPAPASPMQVGDVGAFLERVAEAYRRVGYFHARVSARALRDAAAGTVRYVVRVEEGEPTEVESIEFSGARLFDPKLLVRQVQSVLAQDLGDRGLLQRLRPNELAALAHERPFTARSALVPAEKRWIPELYQRALDDILAAYHSRGYLSAVVGPMSARFFGRRVVVHVPVSEGVQSRIRSVSFLGNEAAASGDLLAALEEEAAAHDDPAGAALALPGAPFSSAGLEDARIALVRHYRNDGYLYARVFADVAFSEERAAADLTFRFEEGPQVRIANVVIRGNRYTEERLIESRMSLRPGDLYRLEQALQDQRSIAALGVFSSVRVRLIDEEAPAERKDVVAEVAERNRQSIEIWPGLSTADGPRLRLDYAHLNILGTASTFNLSLKVNWKIFFDFYGEYADVLRARYDNFTLRERTEAEARAGIRTRLFTLPLEPAVRFDLVGERDNAIPYSLDALRAIFGLDVPLAKAAAMALEPQFSLTNLRCYPSAQGEGGTDCQGDLLGSTRERRRIDKGLRAEFKVGPTLTFDGRDDALSPRKGLFANARAVWAKGATLPPGGDFGDRIEVQDWRPFTFTKLEATLSGYVPLGTASSFALTARVGTIVRGDAPIDERFYLGGSNTLRGFQEDALIPQDHCVITEREQPGPGCIETERLASKNGGFTPPVTQGGTQLALLKSELRLAIADKTLLVLFVDAGNLWLVRPTLARSLFRINPGLGLRYTTPAGPIGLDLGVNTDPEALKGERWFSAQFAVGTF